MPAESFLHQRDDFKALVETVADSEKINDSALMERTTGSCTPSNKSKKQDQRKVAQSRPRAAC
jgi:hypothetical protein